MPGRSLGLIELRWFDKEVAIQTLLKALLHYAQVSLRRRSEPHVQTGAHQRLVIPEVGDRAHAERRNQLSTSYWPHPDRSSSWPAPSSASASHHTVLPDEYTEMGVASHSASTFRIDEAVGRTTPCR